MLEITSALESLIPEGATVVESGISIAGIRRRTKDSGIGIAPDDQPKVFEQFKQVGDTFDRQA